MTAACCEAPQFTLTRCAVSKLDDELAGRLEALTLPTGEMAPVFRTCRNPNRPGWTGTVFVVFAGDEIAGWALRWSSSRGSYRRQVFVFVDERWRRRGVGTMLCEAAWWRLSDGAVLTGVAWDRSSAAFWATIDDYRVFDNRTSPSGPT